MQYNLRGYLVFGFLLSFFTNAKCRRRLVRLGNRTIGVNLWKLSSNNLEFVGGECQMKIKK